MSDERAHTPGERLVGDFMPRFRELTDDLVFGEIWERPGMSPRDRSLITMTSLITMDGDLVWSV